MDTFERIDRICESFYDVGDDLSRWTTVLGSLSRCLGARGCDLHLLRNDFPLFSFIGGAPPEVLGEYLERFIHNEPRSRFLRTAKPGVVATDLQFVTDDFMRTSDYYADFLARAKMGHCIASVPVRSAASVAYFGLHLLRSAGPPERLQMQQVEHVIPHLSRAIRTQFHLIDAQLRNSLYSEAFDSLNIGAIVLGHRGSVLVENRQARQILRDGDVLRIDSGRLVAVVAHEAARLTPIISSAIDRSGVFGGDEIFLGSNGEGISVTIVPATESFRAHTGAVAMVFLVRLDAARRSDWSRPLRDMFGLTVAESRIASSLAAGMSTREIAKERELTYESARTTIKQIFAKTGVKRQAELVALIHTVVPAVIARQSRTG